MKPLFLIPARAGSKGVPGKNIRPLGGKPLIVHSIEHALSVAPAGDVVVSTDSPDISRIASDAGARIPFIRPADLATDTAGSREVMLHATAALNSRGEAYDTIVLLQPTSPLRNPADISRALQAFAASDADMVVSVSPARTNPYYNAFEMDDEGFLKISKGEGKFTRRQDAPEVWEFNGAIYVIRLSSLEKELISRFERILPLPIDPATALDIDSELDFIRAEQILCQKPIP